MNNERIYLCQQQDISDPGSKGFVLSEDSDVAVFVVKKNNQLFAYKNHCPHTGAPLEWKPDQFLDREENYIQCAMHGALFSIESGYCLRGPCAGDSLVRQQIEIEAGAIFLALSKAHTAPE